MIRNIDPGLEEFATERQWEKLQAWVETGSVKAAAEKLGIDETTVRRALNEVKKRAAKRGYSPDHDMTHSFPEGQMLKGISTLYDGDGNIKSQWVKSTKDAKRQEEMFREMVKGFVEELPKATPVDRNTTNTTNTLMACYPVPDLHMGMLAWDKETGQDYDLKISERLIMGAGAQLVTSAPASEQATIVFLGDLMHYDSMEAVTPTSHNILDADSRFPKMVRAAIKIMRHLIKIVLEKHGKVHVIVEIGNHDLSSSIFLMEMLSNVYENEPRIFIDTSPAHYHYFSFGSNLVGVHHGHGCKLPELPLIMAVDRPEAWGTSAYRYWWTGHVHHDQAMDYKGVKVESFRNLAPLDAYAAQKGYRHMQEMKCIVLHEEFGEVARYIVNPMMLEEKNDEQ